MIVHMAGKERLFWIMVILGSKLYLYISGHGRQVRSLYHFDERCYMANLVFVGEIDFKWAGMIQ